MDFDDIVKIVDQVKVLEARLAKAEEERSASNAQLASVLHDIRLVEAERDAARAGEARAVEALRRCHEGAARQLAEPRDHDDDQYALTAIATDCEAVLADSAIALDWLAQQRREAAAEENERWANEWWGLARPSSLIASDFIARAAALRAGEVPND